MILNHTRVYACDKAGVRDAIELQGLNNAGIRSIQMFRMVEDFSTDRTHNHHSSSQTTVSRITELNVIFIIP
jgi:hypothetical protein